MNPVTPLRCAVLSLSVLVLPMSVHAQDEAAETQPEVVAEASAQTQPQGAGFADPSMPADADRVKADTSYSIGYTIGADMAERGVDIDTDQMAAGIRAGLGVDEARLTDDQIAQCLFSLQMKMQEKHFAQAEENMTLGLAYLNENAQKESVVVTESGLQYRVIESGDGAIATIDDNVSAHYRGTLIDGTEFDSSPEGEAVPFPVARVIPGWIEALQLMKVGDKWELVIPSDLAYGQGGTPDGKIPPNSVLIFEIELAEIQ